MGVYRVLVWRETATNSCLEWQNISENHYFHHLVLKYQFDHFCYLSFVVCQLSANFSRYYYNSTESKVSNSRITYLKKICYVIFWQNYLKSKAITAFCSTDNWRRRCKSSAENIHEDITTNCVIKFTFIVCCVNTETKTRMCHVWHFRCVAESQFWLWKNYSFSILARSRRNLRLSFVQELQSKL